MLVQQSCECDLEKVEWTQRALRFARFAKGDRALPALIAAQRFLAASAMAFRPAALRVWLRFAGAIVRGPGGRPPALRTVKSFDGAAQLVSLRKQ